ncbi:MAG: hypothetical protein KGJ62_14800 [Armatimonadetes bacterium]|nr:hypothetical protein [Armatimonadota bacterium]MDE2206193.1 hypothetical protein [Armatimonadota bacterium]
MMKWKVVAVLTVLAVLTPQLVVAQAPTAGLSAAQRLGGALVDPTHSNAWLLLNRTDVQRELAITDQQRQEERALVQATQSDLHNRMMNYFKSFRSNGQTTYSPEVRRQQMAERRKQMRDMIVNWQSDVAKRTQGLLTPEQNKRLTQLDLQWRGPLAMASEDVASELALDAQQRLAVAKLLATYQRAQQKAFQAAQNQEAPSAPPSGTAQARQSGGRQAAVQQIFAARAAGNTGALQLLTPAQRKKWDSMVGRKFDFAD